MSELSVAVDQFLLKLRTLTSRQSRGFLAPILCWIARFTGRKHSTTRLQAAASPNMRLSITQLASMRGAPVTTNTVEGFFSIFKRGMVGTYQHCGEQHLQRYLFEFDFRYSNRAKLGVDDAMRTERAIKGAVGKRLTYRRLNKRARISGGSLGKSFGLCVGFGGFRPFTARLPHHFVRFGWHLERAFDRSLDLLRNLGFAKRLIYILRFPHVAGISRKIVRA